MRPLRVLHVTPYSAKAWAYGGIPRLSDAFARGLARRGHHVTICATDVCDATRRLPSDVPCARFEPRPASGVIPGVTLRVFPNVSNHLAYRWQLFLPLGLGHYLKQSAGEFDVAHLHACRNLPGAIAARHLRRAGVPYVLAPNGTALRIERRRFAKRLYDAAVGEQIIRGASRVIAVSEAERSQFATIGIQSHRIRTVPNPVDLDEFDRPPPRGAFRRRIGVASAPIVLFLGQLSPRKNVEVLVRAFARLREVPGRDGHDRTLTRLVIAGNDMGAASTARRAVRDAGVVDRTIFTGLLCGRERLEALADADVLVYPSKDEIFGLVPLEALLCDTPVVVADDSGCAEVVHAVGGGHVTPLGDIEMLARAIADILDHPARWRAGAVDAAGRVRRLYARDVVCHQLDEVYRELVAFA